MSINRLSLQIGGPGPEEYDKRKVMREVRGVDSEIDSLLEELYVEETQAQYISEIVEEYQPVVEEKIQTRQEKMAESISLYHNKTNQSLVEVESATDSDRIKLLEDAFAQMRRGQPQTLVSGIGASLDSGGGAVWLWDLEDVNIGTPLNGQYPTITDGDALVYNAATKSWVAGTVSGGGAATVDSVNAKTGVVVLDADDVGALPESGGTMSGDITFNSGQAFPDTLSLTNGGVIAGDVTYTGANDNANSLQTLTSVNSLIASGFSAGGNFVFEGTTDVTGAAPTPGGGDFYINTVEGVAESSWTGIAGLTIGANQLVLYSESSARWFAGAVENNSSYLLKTGGTMTGDIEFAGTQTFPSSITSGFLQKSGGTMTGTLITDEIDVPSGKTLTIKRGNNNTSSSGLDIKGYSPNQVGTLTDIFGVTYGNGTSTGDSINYKGRTDGTNNLQTKTSALGLITAGNWTVTNPVTFNGTVTVGSTSSAHNYVQYGILQIRNSSNAVKIQLTSEGEIDCNNLLCTDTANLNNASFSGELNNGTNGHIILSRPTSSAIWFKVKGRTSDGGSTSNTLFDIVKGAGNAVDKVVYYGDTTSAAGEIQTKESVETLIAAQTSAWTTINSSSSGQSSSTMQGSLWYIKYRTTNGGTTVELIVHAAKNGSNVVAGDIVGVLPASLQPSVQVPILFSPKNATTTLSQGPAGFGVIATTGAIAVTFTLNTNIGDQTNTGTGSQDYFANFSYALE